MDTVMPGYTERVADLERGESLPLEELRGDTRSETLEGPSDSSPGGGATSDTSSGDPSQVRAELHRERRDFDGGANALWSLYAKRAKTHDEARFESLTGNMDGAMLFAGLISAFLAPFLIESIHRLKSDPAQESVYYQKQSLAILAQISQQIASINSQGPIPHPPSLSYAPYKPSSSDIRVNTYWLVSLVCSLSAALLALLVRQWVRSYLQVFHRHDHPLKRARLRQFFLEGANGMRTLAEAVLRLIHVSLFLFFLGLGDSMINTNRAVGIITIVLFIFFGTFYLYGVSAHLRNLQSPYRTLISRPIFYLMQKFQKPYFDNRFPRQWPVPTSIEAYQEQLVMKETEERKQRDVRAIRWLVDNTLANGEMESLALAIPDTFNTEWGREVWTDVSSRGHSDPDTLESQMGRVATSGPASPIQHPSCFLEGTSVDIICQCVRYLFETCDNHSYFPNEEARRRRMRACIEAATSLVCCIGFRLEWLGEVGKLISEIGHIEKINQSPTTTSDPSFIVRWTCLSLVVIQRVLGSNRLRAPAGDAVSGLARIQLEYEQQDEAGWRSARWIDKSLKTAWERVEELHRAFEPWTQKRTREQVEEILRNHERQISELERIKVEADSMEDVDWRISLYQDAMNDATYGLTRQLPGVSFDEPHRSECFLISGTFNTSATGSAPVTPQLIYPGQRVQALARVGLKLREVLDGQVPDGHKEVLESLKSVDQVPISLRRPDGLMKRQLWRLQDLRDGGGLGFTVELFFLSLRQLLSVPSLQEPDSVFYIGTFKVITSRWEKSRESLGTQHILLNLICDLIIPGRGVFSDFAYPESITTILLETVGEILQGYTGPEEHIRGAEQEIEGVDSGTCRDMRLQRRALAAISRLH